MVIQLTGVGDEIRPLQATFESEDVSDILKREGNLCPPIWFYSGFLDSISPVLGNPGNSLSSVPKFLISLVNIF